MQPEWVKSSVFYQIFPERFANANASINPNPVESWDKSPTRDNFFGGDLKGISEHLSYLSDMGVNALYLTPIFKADTNHRYDAIDYFKIDSRLGNDADFDEFIKRAHELQIRVVLDGVFNHCGIGHWAFQDVVRNGEQSQYVNWFSVEGFPVVSHPEPNYKTCSGCYYLPKWNVYNPEVRRHHYNVAKYWLNRGIDGWRLDVPYFVNKTFWKGFHKVVKSFGDDKYLVAEEWRNPSKWLTPELMDGTMNYTVRDLVLGFCADETLDAYDFADGMNALYNDIPEEHRSCMLNLLGSHDTERLLTRIKAHEYAWDTPAEDAENLAYALLFAADGAPMVYYGDENGMEGENDPGCRAPMIWNENAWNLSVRKTVCKIMRLRRENAALQYGRQHVAALGKHTVCITRNLPSGRACLCLVHRGSGAYINCDDLPVRMDCSLFGVPSIIGNQYRMGEKSIIMYEGEAAGKL